MEQKPDLDMLCPLCAVNKVQHDGKIYIKKEHIPPKCLYIDCSDGQDLITVPSCESCNKGTSDNDEKFKFYLALYLGYHTEERNIFYNKALETAGDKPKWVHEIISNTVSGLVDGPYGEPGLDVNFDYEVFEIAARKIIRGLHWHVTKEILSPETFLEVRLLKQKIRIPYTWDRNFDLQGTSIKRCGDQFEAIYVIPKGSKNTSMWKIRFYGEDVFHGFIGPKETNDFIEAIRKHSEDLEKSS